MAGTKLIKIDGGKNINMKQKAAMKTIADRAIQRQIESRTKQELNLGQSLVASNALGFNNSNVINIGVNAASLAISQGDGQGNRQGNKITIRKLVFRGTLHPLPYQLSTNPIPKPTQVKVWLFYDRYNPTTTPTPQADFFQNGNSSGAFQNDLIDLWCPINTDKYKVFKTKIFKLGYASFGQSADGVYPSVIGINNNNDFKFNCNFNFDCTKYIPKHIQFRDTSTDPTTRSIYALFAYCAADGTQFSATNSCVGIQYICSVKYGDA